MTIGKGEDWGEIVDAPLDLVEAMTDADVAAHLAVVDPPPVRLRGGDLLASVGGPSLDGYVRRLPIDVLHARTDGGDFLAVAHLVIRRSWWRGPLLVVTNVDRLRGWDVAPRAHPNDGRADVAEVDAAMGVRARWQAWRRLPTGTHVPHPDIRTRQIKDERWTFGRAQRVWIDGVERGPTKTLRVVVAPDAACVHA